MTEGRFFLNFPLLPGEQGFLTESPLSGTRKNIIIATIAGHAMASLNLTQGRRTQWGRKWPLFEKSGAKTSAHEGPVALETARRQ
jgi:hypothetical protein